MFDVLQHFQLLQYGAVMRWDRRIPGNEIVALPAGEDCPPLDYWLEKLGQAETTDEVRQILAAAREELETWRRRPEPAPDGETFEDLKRRILDEGAGWTPKEVALAMRVTPTLVRNVRIEGERDVEYGRPDKSLQKGLALLATGMSLRQVESITGIPKSTLHDAHRKAA
jgi:hypothetical protein